MIRLPMLRALRLRRRVRTAVRPGGRWQAWAAARSGRSRRERIAGLAARTFRRPARPVGRPAIGAVRTEVAAPARPSIDGPPRREVRPDPLVTTHRSIVTLRSSVGTRSAPPVLRTVSVPAVPVPVRRQAVPVRTPVPAPVLRTVATDASPRRVAPVVEAAPVPVRRAHRVEVATRSAPAAATAGGRMPFPGESLPGAPVARPSGPPVGSLVRRAPYPGPLTDSAALSGAGPGPARAAGLPAADVDRLTDQIVSRLDDRLIAHRERLGRAF